MRIKVKTQQCTYKFQRSKNKVQTILLYYCCRFLFRLDRHYTNKETKSITSDWCIKKLQANIVFHTICFSIYFLARQWSSPPTFFIGVLEISDVIYKHVLLSNHILTAKRKGLLKQLKTHCICMPCSMNQEICKPRYNGF